MNRSLALAALLGLLAFTAGADEAAPPSATLEGRPAAADLSPLQSRLDAALPGETIVVEAGTYPGDLLIEKPLHLVGRDRPLLLGSGHGSVVRVRAAGVTIEGFDLDGRGGGDLGRDASGIHVAAEGASIRRCNIRGSLFGVYLREAHGAAVEGSVIEGIPGKEAGEKGSGIHVWNTRGFRLEDNRISDTRDGLYVQSSSHGVVRGNVARDLRYGLHYMFSDDNLFEDNRFENGAAGTALMYSKRIVFRRNQLVRNRGFASVGLLLKACDEVVAEDNLIADNARGLFLEGSYRNVFRGNVVASSDTAIVLYDSCGENRFEGNTFVANLSPLTLVGRRTDTVFAGNYWSDHLEPDLDGDGISDRPYRLSNVFDHFRGNLTAADLMAQGPGARALAAAEQVFPVLDPIPVEDRTPLARPPASRAPRAAAAEGRADLGGLAGSLALLGGGLMLFVRGRRRG
ncbi:MAG TPA: nitrous oxide reductase family maturation protein NosD [Thermoanaerobaculia bacterium]|nr:nitrous oxide reductase family maturation protein NosD [Thermoanaerobaculia bacterium]